MSFAMPFVIGPKLITVGFAEIGGTLKSNLAGINVRFSSFSNGGLLSSEFDYVSLKALSRSGGLSIA